MRLLWKRRAILLAVGAPTVSTVAEFAKRRLGPRTKNIAKLAAVAKGSSMASRFHVVKGQKVLKIWILRH